MTIATTTPTTVSKRLTELRALAQRDPQAAQDAAWAWLQPLGERLPANSAETELAQLFAAGTPAEVDGQTEGILVGWTSPPTDLDRAGRTVRRIGALMTDRLGSLPWLGKKFDKDAQRGTNTVNRLGVLITKMLAPGYRLHKVGNHWEGFEMLNRVEPSVISPDTAVLVLDYESIGTNPWPVNRVRDEAVQIVPDTYLGAKLWHQAEGHRQLAYWAAKSPAL